MTVESSLQLIIEQIEILLIFLARPIVQRQIVALAVILFLTWLLPEVVRAWSKKTDRGRREATWWRWLASFYYLFSPLASLILTQLAIWLFIRLEQPTGLLANSLSIFWLWLAYRLLLTFLYARLGQEARSYHRWILLPLFLLIIAWRAFDSLVGLRRLAAVPVLSAFGISITPGNLFAALIVLYGFFVAAWIIEVALHKTLTPQVKVDPGLIDTLTTISRYIVISFGLLTALYALGVNLSALAFIGGGLSIGVGFGLQQIISNFVSGIVLLFEQALRPGDVIDINGELGVVKKLNMRSTIIRTNDNIEVIVPNETFLTSQVTTFTKTDRQIRMMVPFGVGYDSDPQEVRRIALETAARHGLVLADPAPDLLFRGFGDSSLNFDLAVWIEEPHRRPKVRSDLYYMIWTALAKHNIEIPFPQRDLNLRRGWEKFSDSRPGSAQNSA